MKAGLSVSGYGRTIVSLRNIAKKVPDKARSQMKRSSQRVVELAQKMTPEDEGDLANSIRIEKTYGDNRRLQIDIVVGGKSVVKKNGRSVSLDQYALIVHENYESMKPGDRTREKMAMHPGIKIGSGFLRRALETEMHSFQRVFVRAIEGIITEESL